MTAELLHMVLRRRPFRSFWIRMNDGREFEIPHPELAHLGIQSLTLADPKAEYIFHFDLRLIASIRETSKPETLPSNGGQEPKT